MSHGRNSSRDGPHESLQGAPFMKIEFSGQTVLVTGAASGFGLEIAAAFSERGATVYACDLAEEKLKETQTNR